MNGFLGLQQLLSIFLIHLLIIHLHFAFRFQKLNIPCLQLEINHTIESILQYYVAELEATKKASIMFINRTELFIQKEKYAASICHHYLVPNLLDWE